MIQVFNLTKMYGPRTAIHDLNFEVKKGEIVGFLGPNGAGKTTTMKILTCFMPASSGTAVVGGHDVFEDPMGVKKIVGYLPETPPVYPEMRVDEFLRFCASIHDVPKDKISKHVSDVIEKVRLGEVKSRIIGNLSKGFRQRVGLAQALVHNPPVLILDEPTVGLDPKQIIEIRELIRSLAGDHTIILSTHILPEVTATCGRIIVISRGRIVAQDSLEQIAGRLGKGKSYSMQVRRPNPAGVSAIKAVNGVAQVTVTGPKLMIQIREDAGDCREKVVETAVRQEMGVLEFTSDSVNLEDVFLQLTTDEKNIGRGPSAAV